MRQAYDLILQIFGGSLQFADAFVLPLNDEFQVVHDPGPLYFGFLPFTALAGEEIAEGVEDPLTPATRLGFWRSVGRVISVKLVLVPEEFASSTARKLTVEKAVTWTRPGQFSLKKLNVHSLRLTKFLSVIHNFIPFDSDSVVPPGDQRIPQDFLRLGGGQFKQKSAVAARDLYPSGFGPVDSGDLAAERARRQSLA
jgi:hypothetical protein